MDNLPENIADIDDEQTLITVLGRISGDGDETFTIKGGFIYAASYCACNDYSEGTLLFIQVEDIQEMYVNFKLGLKNRYDFSLQNTKMTQRNYLKFNGSFNLIMIGRGIYQQDDLIFCSSMTHKYIVRINSSYYYVPDDVSESGVLEFEPIKSNFKFNLLERITQSYFKTDANNYRHIIDPYDAEVSFICADTYDVVNPVTGARIKTWPLTLISRGKWPKIKKAIATIGCANMKCKINLPTNVAHLLYDEHLQFYYLLIDERDFHELGRVNSGKATKAAAEAE